MEFISKGILNWEKAYSRFSDHSKSALHVMAKNRKSHISPTIQNKIKAIYSNNIKKNVLKNIHGPYRVMCDGTQDISGQEQEVICIRYVDDKFNANEVLIDKLNSINITIFNI